MKKENRIFYGWLIVAGCFSLSFASVGIAMNSISILFRPVSEALGFSRGDFTMSFTVGAVAIMLSAPFIGKLYERRDARLVVLVSAVLLSGSFALFSLCRTLVQFYAVSALMGVGVASTGLIAVSVLITNWFTERRGLAMGIALWASGLGGLVFNPLGNHVLAQYGWQATYIFFAGAIALFTVVPSLLLRSRPRELGLAPYGASVTAMESAKPEEEGLSLREAVSTMSFWLLALMVFFASVEVMGVQMHLVPYLCDIGHDSAFASLVMGITLGMLVPAKVIVGLVSDRWGIGRALALVFGCTVAGLALLFGADSATAAVTGGVLFSFGITVQTVFPPLMTARSAGLRHFGVVFGVVNLFMMLGSGIGTPLSGYIYDARGSYLPAFKIYIALAVLSAVLGLFAMRASRFGEELGVKG